MKKDVEKNLIEEKDIDLMKDIYLRNERLSSPDLSEDDLMSEFGLNETDASTMKKISEKYSMLKWSKILWKAYRKAAKEKAK